MFIKLILLLNLITGFISDEKKTKHTQTKKNRFTSMIMTNYSAHIEIDRNSMSSISLISYLLKNEKRFVCLFLCIFFYFIVFYLRTSVNAVLKIFCPVTLVRRPWKRSGQVN